jgi:hypothetical protein
MKFSQALFKTCFVILLEDMIWCFIKACQRLPFLPVSKACKKQMFQSGSMGESIFASTCHK